VFLQAVMNLAAPPPLAAQAVGLALFLAGLAVNLHSDSVLRGLRAGGGTGYHIPHGGLFALLSAPHYTGECIEWIGFALFTQVGI
jgi:steroid 5-alpha reductase family enzyme